MKHCRNCDYWKWVGPWRGICTKDRFTKPKWSQSADANGCPDYTPFNRPAYQVATKGSENG